MSAKPGIAQNSNKKYRAAKELLKRQTVGNTKVEQAIDELTLLRSEAIWIMHKIANNMQSGTEEIGMNRTNLEHIFPQKPGAAWQNKTELEPYVWHIGNLTILGEKLNKNAQNKGFVEKRDQYYKKSEVEMTKKILNAEKWDEEEIKKRAKSIVKKINDLWPALN